MHTRGRTRRRGSFQRCHRRHPSPNNTSTRARSWVRVENTLSLFPTAHRCNATTIWNPRRSILYSAPLESAGSTQWRPKHQRALPKDYLAGKLRMISTIHDFIIETANYFSLHHRTCHIMVRVHNARVPESHIGYFLPLSITSPAMVQTRSQAKQGKRPQDLVNSHLPSPKRKSPRRKPATPSSTPRKPGPVSPFTMLLPLTPGNHFQPSRVFKRYGTSSSLPSSPVKMVTSAPNHRLFIAELNETRKRDSVLLKEHDKKKLTDVSAWIAVFDNDDNNDTLTTTTD